METSVKSRLQSVQLGELQRYKNIAVLPLLAPEDGKFQYRTLGEALATSDLAITEISEGGSVPDLKVTNRSDRCVLLVDGEELAGAKQNRVLNTSILLKEASETKIPVSCTEQGRWSYISEAFSESGHIMAHKLRSSKIRSVHCSLESSGKYRSDQGEVWAEIDALHAKAGTSSPTHAMSDVYKARDEDLRTCEEIFEPVANQVGLLVFINGAPAGAEIFSLSSVYAKLHPKLVRSYTLEALLDPGSVSKPSTPPATPAQAPQPSDAPAFTAQARQFLDEIAAAEEHEFPSVGYGIDHRFKAKALAGTALVHENEIIHAAFFRVKEGAEPDHIAPIRQRRRWFSRE